MKCLIPGVNLKVFGRAIHSLAKIGDELYFQPLEQGLSLRTVNSSRSAYACFLFFPSYFQHYDDGRKPMDTCDNSDEEEDEGLRCKITMKSVMAVFRSLSSIEKTVEKCRITHNPKEARLIFELHCWHGIVKKHNLAYMDSERLQAIFSKDICPNRLTAPAKLLCEVVVSFQTTQEEVTLSVQTDVLSLKNYVEDEPDPKKVVHTELSLAPEEFDLYQVGESTSITFCLKELRAILAFGETTGLPLNINFETAGRPVTFSIDSDQTFEANFVLATLAEAEQSTASQVHQSQRPLQSASQQGHQQGSAASQRERHKQRAASAANRASGDRPGADRKGTLGRSAPVSELPLSRHVQLGEENVDENENAGDISAEELAAAMEVEEEWERQEQRDRPQQPGVRPAPHHHQKRKAQTASNSQHGAARDSPEKQTDIAALSQRHTHSQERAAENQQRRDTHTQHRDRGKEKDLQDAERAAPSHSSRSWHHTHTRAGSEQRAGRGNGTQTRSDDEEEAMTASPVIPVQCPTADMVREGGCLQPLSGKERDDLDDTVPGTPPSTPPAKKFRSLFFGSTQKTSRPAHTTTVLAADTDDDDD